MANIIETKGLCKTFSNGGVQQHVLRNIDLEIRKGDFTVIMGASGAGKSTLLYALSGMDKPTLGHIVFLGEDITKKNSDQLALFRRKNCGFVFQQTYLVDSMSLMDNVLSAALLVTNDRKEACEKAGKVLKQVDIEESMWDKFPTQISGGEAQRIKLASELSRRSTGKTIYVLDEPTTGLHATDISKLLSSLNSLIERGHSVIIVEHNLDIIKCADYIIDLGPEGGKQGGYVVAMGTPEEVAATAKGYTARFFKKKL